VEEFLIRSQGSASWSTRIASGSESANRRFAHLWHTPHRRCYPSHAQRWRLNLLHSPSSQWYFRLHISSTFTHLKSVQFSLHFSICKHLTMICFAQINHICMDNGVVLFNQSVSLLKTHIKTCMYRD